MVFNEHSVAAELKTGHFLGSEHCCVGDLVSFCFILCTQCGLDTVTEALCALDTAKDEQFVMDIHRGPVWTGHRHSGTVCPGNSLSGTL